MKILGYEVFYTPEIQFLSLLSFFILLINCFNCGKTELVMDREAQQAADHGVPKSQTRLSD